MKFTSYNLCLVHLIMECCNPVFNWFNPLNPRSDQDLISPNSSNENKGKLMLANLQSFDLQMNSLCQYQKQHIEKSIENMDHDIIIKIIIIMIIIQKFQQCPILEL